MRFCRTWTYQRLIRYENIGPFWPWIAPKALHGTAWACLERRGRLHVAQRLVVLDISTKQSCDAIAPTCGFFVRFFPVHLSFPTPEQPSPSSPISAAPSTNGKCGRWLSGEAQVTGTEKQPQLASFAFFSSLERSRSGEKTSPVGNEIRSRHN